MINDTTKVDAENAEQTVDSSKVPASLTVQDLANIRNLIDVASQRGAFRPSEFTTVGEIYGRLANFIAAITPAQEVPAPVPVPAVEEPVKEGE